AIGVMLIADLAGLPTKAVSDRFDLRLDYQVLLASDAGLLGPVPVSDPVGPGSEQLVLQACRWVLHTRSRCAISPCCNARRTQNTTRLASSSVRGVLVLMQLVLSVFCAIARSSRSTADNTGLFERDSSR